MIKLVGLTVAGVKSGWDVLARVNIAANIEVEESVGHRGTAILANSRLPGDIGKRSISVIAEQLVRFEGAAYEQVFVSIVVIVGK